MNEKWNGKQYLDAPLDEVIDRANQSSNESEIPFVTAVLAAKANRDQCKAAQQTFFTAIASVIVAVLSLASTIYIYRNQAEEEGVLKAEVSSLSGKYKVLSDKLHASEVEHARLTEQVAALKQPQASTNLCNAQSQKSK